MQGAAAGEMDCIVGGVPSSGEVRKDAKFPWAADPSTGKPPQRLLGQLVDVIVDLNSPWYSRAALVGNYW